MKKLEQFAAVKDLPFSQNRLLFEWLRDDRERAALYDELRQQGFPILRFMSMLRSEAVSGPWPDQVVHLVSKRSDVERALAGFSVEPYAALESGGRFMLGLDGPPHDAQNTAAMQALKFPNAQIAACAREAFERAAVQPLNKFDFDLVSLAEQAALHFVSLLFGLPVEAHTRLQRLIGGIYQRLTFQIIGRHFVANAGLPPTRSSDVERLKHEVEGHIREHINERPQELLAKGLPDETVIGRLYRDYGINADDEVAVITLGLIAGTIGNVRAAVAIAIEHFFNRPDGSGGRLLDSAQRAAWESDAALKQLIEDALLGNPPAAFLARTANRLPTWVAQPSSELDSVPEGEHVLLALGAEPDPDLLFGGAGQTFAHKCIGKHLAQPLVREVVRQVLRLPGLAQEIDPDTGKPFGLRKRWGASCEAYKLLHRRDRRLNQQPLMVVLPIKQPIAENARKLELLTRAGAHIIESALRESQHVHFAWFSLVENRTHLAMMTTYDGDFDAYVEHFAVKVSLFDEQFKLLDVEQQTPISQHAKQFVDNIRKYNRAPLGDYFFSAYPLVSVAEIRAAAGLR